MQEFMIGHNDAGQRFDKYLFKLLKNAPKSLLYKQLRNKNITLNKKKASGNEILVEKDLIAIYMSDETIAKFRVDINSDTNKAVSLKTRFLPKLSVVYEDENILIADKPVGMLSQKAQPSDISMNELLLNYLRDQDISFGDTFVPAFCNRLDRNTSGMMLAGVSLAGSQYLSSLLKTRSIHKYYYAIVLGELKTTEDIEGYLSKNSTTNKVSILSTKAFAELSDKEKEEYAGSYIHTRYEPLDYSKEYDVTLLRVELITGKTHQIRAHLAFIKHPILGDHKYGNSKVNATCQEEYQLLHSYEVVFPEGDFPEGDISKGDISKGNISICNFHKLSGKSFHTDYPKRFMKYFPISLRGTAEQE